ncbi:hypothetical protein DFJ68_2803 [Terracoccus luteus]|uniref:N-acetyltransferase domain-containing protein n=1 Tax=Terracoccus luteus TaxID=53356 RepID=A0A495Y2P1_9MICO|nr:GNAT family N-acetyltransferase [Terracoccus luteus]RKT79336.1 hypothetical protein DFJ68_2803 [Terracoccus luteus]
MPTRPIRRVGIVLSGACGRSLWPARMPWGTIAVMETFAVVPFTDAHADGVAAVCAELGWPTYSDPDVARLGCGAPGVSTSVALDSDGAVVGFAHLFGDGIVQGFLAQLGVRSDWRYRGVATALVEAASRDAGVQRVDLLTDDAQGFYSSFAHRAKAGYRIYPGLDPELYRRLSDR